MMNKNNKIVSKLNAKIQELRSQNPRSEGQNNNNTTQSVPISEVTSPSNDAGASFGGRSSRTGTNNEGRVSQITSSSRRKTNAPVNAVNQVNTQRNTVYRCEMDSHADTIVAGANCILMNQTDRVCTVHAYNE